MSNAAILTALESAWSAIQSQHPELPDARIVLASGTKSGRYVKHGHWWLGRWSDAPEVLVAGERLSDGAHMVFETLLHEAVHGLAFARKVKDTSRQGRWHNTRFASIAEEVGLVVVKDARVGHRTQDLTPETATQYAEAIQALEQAMGGAYRHRPKAQAAAQARTRRRFRTLRCYCDREIRVPAEDDASSIYCEHCGGYFA